MRPPPHHDHESREDRFRQVYQGTYDDLLRFVERRVHPSHAEDVVADTFLVAWRRFDDLPVDIGATRAWLFGIARKSLLNDRRSDARRTALAVRIADATTPAPGMDPDFVAGRIDVARAWQRLTTDHQEVLALVAWDGLTSTEAATVLGISPVAFRLRLSRARRALRRFADLGAAPSTPLSEPVTEGSSS